MIFEGVLGKLVSTVMKTVESTEISEKPIKIRMGHFFKPDAFNVPSENHSNLASSISQFITRLNGLIHSTVEFATCFQNSSG